MKLVVYTALVGNIDRLWSVLPGSHDVEHIAFVDKPKHEVGLWGGQPPYLLENTGNIGGLPIWRQEVVERKWGNRRTARHYKTLPHRYLPDADVWMWIDANVRLRTHPLAFVKRHLRGDFATLEHPDRQDVYEEASFCAKIGKDKRTRLTKQVTRYRREGMPVNWGLACTKVVIRRNTKAMRALGEAWWTEIERHSLRDQVSLPYVCWKAGLRWNVIPGICDTRNEHNQLWYVRHTKHG